MKHHSTSLYTILIALLLVGGLMVYAGATGGSGNDPIISLSYLEGLFSDSIDEQITEKEKAAEQSMKNEAERQLSLLSSRSPSDMNCATTWEETRLKEGDTLIGTTGTNALLLAGSGQITDISGTVVDVTTGQELGKSTPMLCNHRYMVGEDSTALFQIDGKTAVLDYQGYYDFSYSDTVDYNAIATALKTLHLFKGSYTGYGQGFDLEVPPTRIQALIMFIRVLGEEDAALASPNSTPFTDIYPGSLSEKYVSYAYEKGYTNGYTTTLFKPNQTITATQYMEFLLRALGYSSTSNTDLSSTLINGYRNDVITDSELSILQTDPFLRAELVYLSYYGLDADMAGTHLSLRNVLMDKGVFTQAESSAADGLILSERIF